MRFFSHRLVTHWYRFPKLQLLIPLPLVLVVQTSIIDIHILFYVVSCLWVSIWMVRTTIGIEVLYTRGRHTTLFVIVRNVYAHLCMGAWYVL